MGHYLTYALVLLITIGSIRQVKSSFHKSRTWHEEFVPKSGELGRVLNSNYKTCVSPGEKPEQIVNVENPSNEEQLEASENQWSDLMSMFASHGGFEVYSWDLFTKEADPETATMGLQVWGMLVFILFAISFFILFTCFIPVIGCFMFTICHLAWSLIFHSEIRRICRRILIIQEKIYIKIKSLIPRKDRNRSKKPFRLPFLLREYSEEEVPAELMVSDEDSEPEVSSDGFEDLFTKTKGREATGDTDKTHLRHLMATTEKEFEDHRRGSVESRVSNSTLMTLKTGD